MWTHWLGERMGTVAAWRREEWGAPSSLPTLPHPTTVPTVGITPPPKHVT